MQVAGPTRVLMRTPKGEVNAAVLAYGTIAHFPVSAGLQFSTLLIVGQTLAVAGSGVTNDYGRSLEVTAMGATLETLQPVAAGCHP
jgi:hypothetical protein